MRPLTLDFHIINLSILVSTFYFYCPLRYRFLPYPCFLQGVAQLLNVGDMQLVPKQDIFHTGYRRMNTAPGTHGVAGEAGIINFEMENAGYNIRLPPQPVDMPDHHMAMDIGEVAMWFLFHVAEQSGGRIHGGGVAQHGGRAL